MVSKKYPDNVPSEEIEIREGLEGLTPARIITLYRRAPLRRPVSDSERVWQMFEHASLVITAWKGSRLVGIARVLTDGVLFSFLCDLAVEPDVQGHGLGKHLVRVVQKHCKGTDVLVRGADISSRFYSRLGFKQVQNAWFSPA